MHTSSQKAGETLLAQALESRRDICKTLLTTSSAALGVYLTLLGLVLDKGKAICFLSCHPVVASVPVVLFIFAASMYVCGYFHAPAVSAERVLAALRSENEAIILGGVSATLKRRFYFLWAGNSAFWCGVCSGLYSVVVAARGA